MDNSNNNNNNESGRNNNAADSDLFSLKPPIRTESKNTKKKKASKNNKSNIDGLTALKKISANVLIVSQIGTGTDNKQMLAIAAIASSGN